MVSIQNDFDGAAPPTEPADANQPDPRVKRRESLFLGVEIHRAGTTQSGRIRNISATGALVDSDLILPMGERLTLNFRGVGDIGATVVRKTAKGVGVRFEREIDPSACRVAVSGEPDERNAWSAPLAPHFQPPGMGSRARR